MMQFATSITSTSVVVFRVCDLKVEGEARFEEVGGGAGESEYWSLMNEIRRP